MTPDDAEAGGGAEGKRREVLGSSAETERTRLEEMRLVGREGRVEAELARGHQLELVPKLEALVTKYPLRERLREQLMLALHRSGRNADALQVYQEFRRLLAEEIEIEPSPNLQLLAEELGLEPELPRPIESPAIRNRELVCVECGATTKDGTGWRAELAPDDTGAGALEVPVYCPDCWEREFGNQAGES